MASNLGPSYASLFVAVDSEGNNRGEFTTEIAIAQKRADAIGGKVWETPAFIYLDRLSEVK